MLWHLNLDGRKMYYKKMIDDYPLCGDKTYIILKDKSLSVEVRDYSFWFEKKLSGKKIFEAAKWCDENLKGDYLVGKDASGFNNEYDAMAFRLRWA